MEGEHNAGRQKNKRKGGGEDCARAFSTEYLLNPLWSMMLMKQILVLYHRLRQISNTQQTKSKSQVDVISEYK